MSNSDVCSCDDAAYWKRRALAAELSLAFARRQFENVLALMPMTGRSEPPAAVQPTEEAASV